MKFITVDNNLIVTSVHNMPFDEKYGLKKSKEELEKVGYFVEEILEPEEKNEMRSIQKYDPESNSVYYEYQSRELTPEEKIIKLEAEKEVLKQQQAQLNADLTAFMDYYFSSTTGN